MKNTHVLVVLILTASVTALLGQNDDRGKLTTAPVFTGLIRQGAENKLSSPRDPNVVLQFGSSFRHLGGQKFVLYGVADTEQHFFVETTAENRLKSLYWIQFEEYLPDNTYTYDYEDSASRITLNNYEFYLDTVPVQSDAEKSRPGSDGALTRQFLGSKGYTYPEQYFLARLVYLTDKSRRKELMIIYIEDLASTGLTASDLSKDGKAADRWPEIEKKYLDRIKATLKVIPLQSN